MLDAQVIKKLIVDAAQTTRDWILNVAHRVAPELVGIQSEAVIADCFVFEQVGQIQGDC